MEPAHVVLGFHLDTSYGRGVLRGVARYVRGCAERPFRFEVVSVRWLAQRMETFRDGGVIANVADPETAAALRQARATVVNVGNSLPSAGFPQVAPDDEQIGTMAAEYFIHRGYRSFGYVGLDGYRFSDERAAAFQRRLSRDGLEMISYPHGREIRQQWNWEQHRQRFQQWALSLPRPVAVFACLDRGARQVIETCLAAGLRVPEDVAVLGVDNNEVECELADVPMSSIALAEDRIGYEAAALLHGMLDGKPSNGADIRVSPIGVVTRTSSDNLAFDDPQVNQAMRYIRAHIADSIKVTDILSVVDLSRRELERRFQKYLGHSPHTEIRRTQIDRAKELLAETDLPMTQVALAGGFKESKRLSVVFRQEVGMSPSEYRREYRCTSE